MERSRSAALIIRKVCAAGIWRSVARQTRTTQRGATALGGKWADADEEGGAAASGHTPWDQRDHGVWNDRKSDGSPVPECGMGLGFPFSSGVNAADASAGQGSASSVASWHDLRWRLRLSEPAHPYAVFGINRPLVNDEYLRERLTLLWKTPLGSTVLGNTTNQTEGAFNIKSDDLNFTCPTSSMEGSIPLEASSVKRKRKKKMNKHKQRKLRRRERNKNENKR
ncbi:hypothetical protein CBR_g51418 [Chara braunii]|uniref:Ribosomal protein mS38 C-terminal domain-containing protein n=1 Tax=Chara braunii TaxID=69332 RepID=A0A388M8M9_CHABU|nr:hypothetical protein CBR_g51418 [Chara braunii]|eukprot:GBG90911.1 hypothetical protein CBR_g51418 [Chara braunii]